MDVNTVFARSHIEHQWGWTQTSCILENLRNCTQHRVSENRLSLGSMHPENSCPAVCSPEDCNKALQKGKKDCLEDISISTIVWIHMQNILCPSICLDLFLQFSSNSIS
jgi:hypothetical protein